MRPLWRYHMRITARSAIVGMGAFGHEAMVSPSVYGGYGGGCPR